MTSPASCLRLSKATRAPGSRSCRLSMANYGLSALELCPRLAAQRTLGRHGSLTWIVDQPMLSLGQRMSQVGFFPSRTFVGQSSSDCGIAPSIGRRFLAAVRLPARGAGQPLVVSANGLDFLHVWVFRHPFQRCLLSSTDFFRTRPGRIWFSVHLLC